jgi:PIN domain nuclease of toxin-antitoxin system
VKTVLLDTHTWAWSLFQPAKLSQAAYQAIEGASLVYVAPCTFHEITQKHRSGKWPEVGAISGRLISLLEAQGGIVAPYTARMAILSGSMEWTHRDPFDRMIAATAIEMACPLISKDPAFDELKDVPGWKGRIWLSPQPEDPEPSPD